MIRKYLVYSIIHGKLAYPVCWLVKTIDPLFLLFLCIFNYSPWILHQKVLVMNLVLL